MSASITVYQIITSSLMVLALLLIPLGLGFLLLPEKTFKLTSRLNHWVPTDRFFGQLNQPRFQERFFYRYHRLFGTVVIGVTLLCLYMMLFYTDSDVLINNLASLSESLFGEIVIQTVFWSFVLANIVALILGLLILLRPSLLKPLEKASNHWVDVDAKASLLDKTRDIPESAFHKHPRLFGIMIILGAVWIILNSLENLV